MTWFDYLADAMLMLQLDAVQPARPASKVACLGINDFAANE